MRYDQWAAIEWRSSSPSNDWGDPIMTARPREDGSLAVATRERRPCLYPRGSCKLPLRVTRQGPEPRAQAGIPHEGGLEEMANEAEQGT